VKELKIAQLTMLGREYNYNLGANLQAYALHTLLLKSGFNVEIIDYSKWSRSFARSVSVSIKSKGIKYVVSRALPWLKRRFFEKKERLVSRQISPVPVENRGVHARIRRIENIKKFKERFLRFSPRKYCELADFKKIKNSYDAYVVGSDLVWSPKYNREEHLSVYLLSFVGEGKLKISYAASVGEKIPEWAQPLFRRYIPKFHFLSVREKESARAIEHCTGIRPEVVLDPTALLSDEEWMSIAKKPVNFVEPPYILVYDLYRSNEIKPVVEEIGKRKTLNLVKYSCSKNCFSFYSYGPREFLWLIKNAEFVVSSSFHGTLLAVIFNKPFYAVDPSPFAPRSRILNFLDDLGLRNRFIVNPKDLLNLSFEDTINWDRVNELLEDKKRYSLNFLKKALEALK